MRMVLVRVQPPQPNLPVNPPPGPAYGGKGVAAGFTETMKGGHCLALLYLSKLEYHKSDEGIKEATERTQTHFRRWVWSIGCGFLG